jgi:hypothetical protein
VEGSREHKKEKEEKEEKEKQKDLCVRNDSLE